MDHRKISFIYTVLYKGVEEDSFTKKFDNKENADVYCAYLNHCYAKGMNCAVKELPNLYKVVAIQYIRIE